MKKLIYSLFALAMTAMTFTGCEDVPAPYDIPSDSDTTHVTPIAPSGTGTKDDPYNVAAALDYITSGDTDNVYVKGIITGTPNVDTSYGNATYYISDDGNGNNQIEVFRGYYFNGEKFTSENQIQEGDTVVVYGKPVNYNGTNELTIRNYIYSINGKTGDSGNTDEPSGEGTETSPYNVAKTKVLFDSETLPTDNVYIQGIVAKTGTVDSKYGNMTYYISDDGQSSNDLEIYHGLYLKGDKFTSTDQLAVGDTVVVLGQLTTYTYNGTTSLEVKNSQLVSIIGHQTPDENSITVNAADMGFTDKGTADKFTLSDGTTLTFDKGDGTTAPAYYAGSYAAVRLYAKNTLTIAANKNIAKITIMTTDPDTKKYYNGNNEAYAMSGETKVSINKASDTQAVFSGLSASTITIVNDFSEAKGGTQLRIKSITITYAK